MSHSEHSTEALAYQEILAAVNARETALRNMRSHKPVNAVRAALMRIQQWTRSYPCPSRATLQTFLLTYRRELELVITGDQQGRNRMHRITHYITSPADLIKTMEHWDGRLIERTVPAIAIVAADEVGSEGRNPRIARAEGIAQTTTT